jgi:hypothetical protein
VARIEAAAPSPEIHPVLLGQVWLLSRSPLDLPKGAALLPKASAGALRG